MKKQEITLQTILDVMNSKFEKVEKRLDNIDNRLGCVETRLDNVENRLDNMDIRITKLAADNKEAHEKIFEELQKQSNTITRIETEFGDKLAILFDANEYTRDRLHLFGNQQLRFAEQLEKFSYRLGSVEKAVFSKN